MPIYGFECTDCGHRFDRLQKLSDPDPTVCPSCQAVALRRQVSAPAFRLAGGGWYETDFKGEGDRKRNLAGGDDAPKSDAAKSTEAKPAETAKPAESKPATPAPTPTSAA